MRSIAPKISVPIVLSIFLFFGILGYYSYTQRRASFRRVIEQSSETTLRVIAHGLAFLMEAESWDHAREFMRVARAEMGVAYLEARSPDGQYTLQVPDSAGFPPGSTEWLRVRVPLPDRDTCRRCHTMTVRAQGYVEVRRDIGPLMATARSWYTRAMLTHLLASILLSLSIAVTVHRTVRRPLHRLIGAMEQVAQGRWEVVLPIQGQDEIASLARHFNSMLERLRVYQEEREREQRAKIQQAEHMMTVGEMATSLAHEIKNPLAGIQSALSILFEQEGLRPEAREVYESIMQDLSRINQVLEDLLQYARPRPIEWTAVDLGSLVESVIVRVLPMTREKGLELRTGSTGDVPVIQGDPYQLHQMLYNLLLNAIQATDEGGQVTVGLRSRPATGEVELWVEDTGHGIPPDKLELVIKPFYSTKPGGTGLGLPICLRIIENHGGRLLIESEVGRGSTFRVYLPVRGTGRA
ncbi:MAG: ATP-binding protein [Acidobacteriota bacterium]|nr:ATP-binding protein [Acidobacteriota bacterium]